MSSNYSIITKGYKNEWGPKSWMFLHLLAITYKPEHKKEMIHRLRKFFRGIPCGECNANAKKYCKENPPDLTDSISFQVWVFNFHNFKNKLLNKKTFSWKDYEYKYADAKEYFRSMPSH